MTKLDHEACGCACHKTPGLKHTAPCCWTCPWCGKHVAPGHEDMHALSCAMRVQGEITAEQWVLIKELLGPYDGD